MWVDCDGQGQAWTRSAEKTDIYDDDDDEGETHECIDDEKASAALAFKLIVKVFSLPRTCAMAPSKIENSCDYQLSYVIYLKHERTSYK